MEGKFRYIEKKDRKNILLLCDDIRMHSGIATMAREFVIGTSHHFNWFNVGAAINHPEAGKVFDLSDDVNKNNGLEDADVKVMPNNGYGDAQLIRNILKQKQFDAIFIFTDPRYWTWLFDIEREIRSEIPIMYLNIWDDYPTPLYNKSYYESVDLLMAISKQTKNINELVLGEKAKDKIIEYVPHGIDQKQFFPILKEDEDSYSKLQDFKKSILKDDEIDFTVFFNSRNIRRKNPGDVILAYRFFCDIIGEEKAKKCALIMHTQPVDGNGTDLYAVREAICQEGIHKVYFSSSKINSAQMNLLYNLSDVTMLISSNEGWGLSLTESMMAGTMIIGNVTGGIQDQMRFEDKEGKWVDFSSDFPSNHRGTIKKCGEWAIPVFPSNISMVGSPATPYIFDDRCRPEDAAQALFQVWSMNPEERKDRGLKGRQWAMSDEAGLTAEKMSNRVIEYCDKAMDTFKPRPAYEIHKIENRPKKQILHKLIGY